ncbi:hypothetical protein H5410_008374 [Solanum commersonii]|uniref:Uncharacterized protein n=1 Tax=Solanum commersonii TaxID=4109 RepID=A0A9J6AFU1_SOLCO|nr:hypothetical protein H5410_008374 [Solanum commersonii]
MVGLNKEDADTIVAPARVLLGLGQRGGEPDYKTAAKMVLHDWQRGKVPPPKLDDAASDEQNELVTEADSRG